MKKITSLAVGVSSFLAVGAQAFAADTAFNACGGGPDSQFANLCKISQNPGDLVSKFLTIVIIVAILASLFFLIYGGIRWITSGGDEKQVEAAKSHVVAAIVGLVIALAAFFLIQFIGKFFAVNLLNFKIPDLIAPTPTP